MNQNTGNNSTSDYSHSANSDTRDQQICVTGVDANQCRYQQITSDDQLQVVIDLPPAEPNESGAKSGIHKYADTQSTTQTQNGNQEQKWHGQSFLILVLCVTQVSI